MLYYTKCTRSEISGKNHAICTRSEKCPATGRKLPPAGRRAKVVDLVVSCLRLLISETSNEKKLISWRDPSNDKMFFSQHSRKPRVVLLMSEMRCFRLLDCVRSTTWTTPS